MVLSGFEWFLVVFGGFRWFWVVLGGSGRSIHILAWGGTSPPIGGRGPKAGNKGPIGEGGD